MFARRFACYRARMRRGSAAAIGSSLALLGACGPVFAPSDGSDDRSHYTQSTRTIAENPDPVPELGMGGGPMNEHGPGPYWVGGEFEAVSVGALHACALRADGTVVCWGNGSEPPTNATCLGGDVACGQARPPTGTFKQISAGDFHTCGLRSDGSLACWGAGVRSDDCEHHQCGQAAPPEGQFIAVAAGDRASCAIRLDGTLVCWGAGRATGTCGLYDCGQAKPPDGEFTMVSASYQSACALASDGKVTCWGNPDFFAASNERFTKLATGEFTACGLREDGTIGCMETTYNDLATPPGSFVDIDMNLSYACAIGAEGGRLVCWGEASGYTRNAPLGEFRTLSVGYYAGCALRTDDRLVCWGDGAAAREVPEE